MNDEADDIQASDPGHNGGTPTWVKVFAIVLAIVVVVVVVLQLTGDHGPSRHLDASDAADSVAAGRR